MVSKLKFNSLLLVVILAASCGGAKHLGKTPAALPGTWQQQPIVIDGDSKDWPSPYPNYDAKAKVAYATSNDRENLYITMETGDEMTQMKILKQGMVVSIDTGGHKNAEFNINYPLLNENDALGMDQKDFGKKKSAIPGYEDKQLEKKLSKTVLDANQFTVEGFMGCSGGYMVKQTTPCGISVRMSIKNWCGKLSYRSKQYIISRR